MEKQKDDARRAWKGSGEAATETVWFDVKDPSGDDTLAAPLGTYRKKGAI